MTDLTCNAGTGVDARDALGYFDDTWADDPRRGLPATTMPHVLNVHQAVLIWYCRDNCWHVGKVVRYRNTGLYEIEFTVGGPRIRDWYHPSTGFIKPDTPHIREMLRAHGRVVVTKDSKS